MVSSPTMPLIVLTTNQKESNMKHTHVTITKVSIGGVLKAARPIVQRIVCEYDDGRIQTDSGDVWTVKEVDGKLITVH